MVTISGPAFTSFRLEPHLRRSIEVLEHVGSDAGALLDQPEQDVLGADVLVVEPLGLLVGQSHDLAGSIGEALEHRLLSRFLGAGAPFRPGVGPGVSIQGAIVRPSMVIPHILGESSGHLARSSAAAPVRRR